jgi:hypothetical protein
MSVVPEGVFPFPYWWADNTSPLSNSKWIGANLPPSDVSGGLYSQPQGYYDYQTTFTTSSFPGTKTLTGIWASDNEGIAIFLNGDATNQGGNLPSGSMNFSGPPFSPFTISGLAANTTYTLGFVVLNDFGQVTGNPSGFRAEFTPEPGFYGVLSLGLAGLALVKFRRSNVN